MRMPLPFLIGWLILVNPAEGLPAGEDNIHVDSSKLGAAQTIYVYDGGSIALKRSIEPDSADARAIAAWLKSHEDGWESSLRIRLTSYAPHKYIRGERFTLNFFSDGACVLGVMEGEGKERRGRQMTRKVDKDDPMPKVFHAAP